MMTPRRIRRFHWWFFWTVSIILYNEVTATRLTMMVGLFLQLMPSAPLLKRVVKSPQNKLRRRRGEASGKRLPIHCIQKMHLDGGRRTKCCMYMLSESIGISMTSSHGLNSHRAAGRQKFCPSLQSPL
jgi:hypothetical protein